MSPILFQLGPITVRWYGLMYVVAIIVGIFLTRYLVKRRGLTIDLDDILDFVLITIPIAIIFARLYYVAFQWDSYYRLHLNDIYRIWQGGLAIHGGIIGGAFALWIFARWKKLPYWQFADLVVPSLILGQALGRFGNFMNGDAYGTPTDLPWGMTFPASSPAGQHYCPGTPAETCQIPLHPAMLYEMIGNLIIFGILMWLINKRFRDGFVTSFYLILYSVLRFFVEIVRGDSLYYPGFLFIPANTLKAAQVISILIVIIFVAFIWARKLYQREAASTEPHRAVA
jgi:phosphatidylglycerol:prolipoprotein diacylglycerol transferase